MRIFKEKRKKVEVFFAKSIYHIADIRKRIVVYDFSIRSSGEARKVIYKFKGRDSGFQAIKGSMLQSCFSGWEKRGKDCKIISLENFKGKHLSTGKGDKK